MEDFLRDLAARGCRFWLDDGKLRMTAPSGLVTPELKETLRERKAAIIAYLQEGPASAGEAARLQPRGEGAAVPLLRGQRRILDLAGAQKHAGAYNVPMAFDLAGPLDVAALRAALAGLERRHESLRTSLTRDGQVVHPPGSWDGLRIATPAPGALERDLQDEAGRGFDLASGPLWRVCLATVSPLQHVLCMVFHHAIFDGHSRSVFLRELALLYRAETEGGPGDPLPPLAVQAGDAALWLAGTRGEDALRRDMAYWEGALPRRVRETALPAPPADPAVPPATISRRFVLDAHLAGALHHRTGARPVLPAALLLAACALLLHRHTGQTGLLFCVPLTNRPLPELEPLIGYFNSVVPIHLEIDAAQTIGGLAESAHRRILEASSHQGADLQDIARLEALARTPLNRAMVSVQQTRDGPFALHGLTVAPRLLRNGEPDFDLAFQFELAADTLVCLVDASIARFSPAGLDALTARLAEIIGRLVTAPGTPVGDLPFHGVSPRRLAALLEADPRIDEVFVAANRRAGTTTAWMKLNEDNAASLDDIRAALGSEVAPWQIPANMVPVDDLPRSAEGKVDLARLRALARARERAGEGRRPPGTPLEKTIAGVWQRVLWLDRPVGMDDRFHDLGGHSLLAVRMIAALEAEFGRPLPPRALRELTTLEAFAGAIARDDDGAGAAAAALPGRLDPTVLYRLQSHTASWQGWRSHPDALIVGKNVEGARVPLFWCLQNYNELCQLAAYMGADQPVYGMRSGNRAMVKNQANIDRLAEHYVGEIAQILPPGRLLVGGNCQAAQIAFQIACRLPERGYTVPLLYLHEKFVDMPYGGAVALSFGRESERNPYLHDEAPERTFARAYSGPLSVDLVPGSHAQFFREPNVQDLTAMLKRRRDEHLGPP